MAVNTIVKLQFLSFIYL